MKLTTFTPKFGKTFSTIASLFLASTLCCQCEDVTILNPGFEADHVIPGNFSIFVPDGWDIYDPEGIIDQGNDVVGGIDPAGTPFFTSIPEGQRAAIVFLGADSGTSQPAGLSQTLETVLQPYSRYTLTVEIGNIASGTGLPPSDVFGFFNLAGFPGYRVELLAGTNVIASDDNSLFGLIPEAEWRRSTVELAVAGSHPQLGNPLGIRLINLNLPGTAEEPGIEVDFDDVQLQREPIVAPQLSIVQHESTIQLTWEEPSTIQYIPEFTENLNHPIEWTTVTDRVQIDEASRTLVLDIDSELPQRYFRLRSMD